MLWLSFPEIAHRFYFGHDLAWPDPRCVHVRDRVFGNRFLFVIHIVNGGPITASAVVTLAVFRCRVMDLEKELQKRTIAGFRGVKEDLDPFGMGSVVAVCELLPDPWTDFQLS